MDISPPISSKAWLEERKKAKEKAKLSQHAKRLSKEGVKRRSSILPDMPEWFDEKLHDPWTVHPVFQNFHFPCGF